MLRVSYQQAPSSKSIFQAQEVTTAYLGRRNEVSKRLALLIIFWYYYHVLTYDCHQGNCRVIVEYAGPHAVTPRTVFAQPSKIRELAYWITENCVGDEGTGGYATHGFTGLSNYLTGLDVNFSSFRTWGTEAVGRLSLLSSVNL